MSRSRLLDLYCGWGGAATGYQRAGFDVVGVDVRRVRFPFPFVQGDALRLPVDPSLFDAIHASPPCQAFSALNRAVGNQSDHENLIPPTRAMLRAIGLPYIIENVPEAPLENGGVLCGATFGLEVLRHRRFETNWGLLMPECTHKRGGAADGTYVMFGGRSPRAPGRRKPPRAGEREWRDAAGLEFMPVREARQAIPPAYTEFIGEQLLAVLEGPA